MRLIRFIQFIFFSFLFFCASFSFASPFNHIVFFGDSLSDDGNLYRHILKFIPKSPPYYLGRFSNGPTWAESVGKYYYDKYYIDYEIYAVGGATAIFHMPTTKFLSPSTLQIQVDEYLVEAIFQDKTDVLYVIWIGANDYFASDKNKDDADVNELTGKVVDKIGWAISTLVDYGANNFLVLSLPNLSSTPYAQTADADKQKLAQFSQTHNEKLLKMIEVAKKVYPNIKLSFIDAGGILADALSDPEKYNKKYNVHIINTTESCWDGGYMFKALYDRALGNNRHLNTELQQLLANSDNKLTKNLNVTQMSNTIVGSPSLSVAYITSKMYEDGQLPCNNANEYIFWDEMHPTETVHQILAKIVEANLDKDYQFKT